MQVHPSDESIVGPPFGAGKGDQASSLTFALPRTWPGCSGSDTRVPSRRIQGHAEGRDAERTQADAERRIAGEGEGRLLPTPGAGARVRGRVHEGAARLG